jgi:hypothetical protein
MEKDILEWSRKQDYKGFNIHCWRLKGNPHKDVLIEIWKDGKILREFLYPAYKQYNLQAHFEDIVEGELQNSTSGYEAASWNGITNAIIIIPNNEAK